MQRPHEERSTAASRIADFQAQDRFRFLGDADRWAGIGYLPGLVAQRFQGAVDGRHGQLRTGVERAGALAGVASPHEVELAHGHDSLDEAVERILEELILPDDEQTRIELSKLVAPWLIERDGIYYPPILEMAAAILYW